MEGIAECFETGPFTVNRNYIEEILVRSGENAQKPTKKNLRNFILLDTVKLISNCMSFLRKCTFFWPELTVPKEQRVQRDKAAHCTVGKP